MRALHRSLAVMLALSPSAFLVGCGGAAARPPSPAPVATIPVPPQEPPTASQAFAEEGPPLAFQDPERRKKLAVAFPGIDEIARDELVRQELPSIALGVVIDGDLAYARGFSARGGDATVEPDADTVFRIGSITKSFTAAVILSLRDEGALSLDDPLVRWVPEAAGLVYPTHDTPREPRPPRPRSSRRCGPGCARHAPYEPVAEPSGGALRRLDLAAGSSPSTRAWTP